jgi:hypothetical protein
VTPSTTFCENDDRCFNVTGVIVGSRHDLRMNRESSVVTEMKKRILKQVEVRPTELRDMTEREPYATVFTAVVYLPLRVMEFYVFRRVYVDLI